MKPESGRHIVPSEQSTMMIAPPANEKDEQKNSSHKLNWWVWWRKKNGTDEEERGERALSGTINSDKVHCAVHFFSFFFQLLLSVLFHFTWPKTTTTMPTTTSTDERSVSIKYNGESRVAFFLFRNYVQLKLVNYSVKLCIARCSCGKWDNITLKIYTWKNLHVTAREYLQMLVTKKDWKKKSRQESNGIIKI